MVVGKLGGRTPGNECQQKEGDETRAFCAAVSFEVKWTNQCCDIQC